MKLKKHLPKLFLLSMIFLSSCLHRPDKGSTLDEPNFDWLLGKWEKTNGNENHQTFEYWTKVSETEYHGFGFTLQKYDTLFKENIKLINAEGIWVYEVYGVNEQPTPFVINYTTDTSFTCINEKNEFPKKIKYFIADTQLLAIISDKENEFIFRFMQLTPKK